MCLGIPGRVISIYDADGVRMGKVDFDGIVKEVCLSMCQRCKWAITPSCMLASPSRVWMKPQRKRRSASSAKWRCSKRSSTPKNTRRRACPQHALCPQRPS